MSKLCVTNVEGVDFGFGVLFVYLLVEPLYQYREVERFLYRPKPSPERISKMLVDILAQQRLIVSIFVV